MVEPTQGQLINRYMLLNFSNEEFDLDGKGKVTFSTVPAKEGLFSTNKAVRIEGTPYWLNVDVGLLGDATLMEKVNTAAFNLKNEFEYNKAAEGKDYGASGGGSFDGQAPRPRPAFGDAAAKASRAVEAFDVHFAWDKHDISPAAGRTLDEMAERLRKHPEVKWLRIAGHADTTGTDAYNQQLSGQRAEAIRDGLVARGVNPDILHIEAMGKRELLVKTPDGVREDQNRLTRISFETTTFPPPGFTEAHVKGPAQHWSSGEAATEAHVKGPQEAQTYGGPDYAAKKTITQKHDGTGEYSAQFLPEAKGPPQKKPETPGVKSATP